jgi:hypothetical protein
MLKRLTEMQISIMQKIFVMSQLGLLKECAIEAGYHEKRVKLLHQN